MPTNLPMRLSLGSSRPGAGIPDPLRNGEFYQGVLFRRIVAYLVDLVLIGAIYVAAFLSGLMINLATFGLMSALIVVMLACVAPAYHVLTVGGPAAATPGMRLLGLEVRSFDGNQPDKLQAFIQIALFYVTVPTTGGWILLFALFNRYRRTLHDLLSNTVVLRRLRQPVGNGVRLVA
jgi:uncharacterized RDD family membrane protein YckC